MTRFRDNTPFKTDKNGTQYFYDYTCRRCGGQGGAQAWIYTGYTCYDCGGSGRAAKPRIIKIYTPEYEKKLAEQREKRWQKKVAEYKAQASGKNAEFFKRNAFDEAGVTYVALGNTYQIKDQLKEAGFKYDTVFGWHADHEVVAYPTVAINAADVFGKNDYDWYVWELADAKKIKSIIREANDQQTAAKDTSEYVGSVGEKITVTATLERAHEYSYSIGWKTIYSTAYTFKDDAGNTIVWKTQKYLDVKEGQQVTVTGTVKEHNTYKGKKQTIITRANVA